MKLQRYERTGCTDPTCQCGGAMEPSETGEWVKLADVIAEITSTKPVSITAELKSMFADMDPGKVEKI